MGQWNDVYFRTNQNDTGTYPTNGCLSSCFDIITRQEPLSDPSSLINSDWNNNNSQEMNARMNNYIYVRGTNLSGKDQKGQVYLYYSQAHLLLYPNLWAQNIIKVGDTKDSFEFSVGKDDKFVCSDDQQGCFCWKPEMITNDHYCLVSRAVTSDHPADIPSVGTVTDFGKFISENRSYGWRNVSVVDKNTADFTQSVKYSQGEEEADMHIILSCKGVPVGAEVAFDCPSPGTTPPIHMARTKVTQNEQDLGMICHIPKNFNGEITYSYWGNGYIPSENFEISLHAVMFVPNNHVLYQYAKHHEELGYTFDKKLRNELRLGDSIGPERGIILGQYTTQMAH